MALINLEQVCKDYYGEPQAQVNLNRLRIESLETTWCNIQQPNGEGADYQVQVDRFETNLHSASSVANANTIQVYAKYQLDKEYIKGLNTPLKVPLDGSLQDKFGASLDINVGKRESSVQNDIPLTVTAHRDFGQGQASEQATISVRTPRAIGRFECKAKMRGIVVFPTPTGADQIDIVDVFADQGLLGGEFARHRNEVHFTVRGQCRFQVGNQETVQYNS